MDDLHAAADPATLDPVWRQLLPALVQHQSGMLAVKRLSDGVYVHANAAMAAFMAGPTASMLGRTDAELFEPAVVTALRAAEATALAHAAPFTSEHVIERGGKRREFSVLRVVVRASPSADLPSSGWLCSVWTDVGLARQRESHLQSVLAQVQDQQQANDDLRRELADHALRDAASGLHTGTHFEEQLRRELDLSSREHREFALVLIELDPPSALAQAPAAHERILEAMGRLLSGGTRAMDASCRIEGRRFAVLLSGVGLATAHSRMESLRRQCATQIVMVDGQEVRFSVAMGVASFPHTAGDRDQLVQASESALALARSRGGNVVTLASIRFDAAL
jgi:diguanylate cyclase (GGDEF)-like protein